MLTACKIFRNSRKFVPNFSRYSPNKLSKLAWKQIETGAPDLFSFLQGFNFRVEEFYALLKFYARNKQFPTAKVACDWLHHLVTNRCLRENSQVLLKTGLGGWGVISI